MNRIVTFTKLCAIFLMYAVSAQAGSLLQDIVSKGEMVVATNADYPPQSLLNEKGQFEGFDIEVAREIAKRLGVTVRFVTPIWKLVTIGNWGREWDVSIGSMTPTRERKKVLLFTMPYYSSPAQFAVHKDNVTIKKLDDLAGKVIGVADETTNERYLNRNLQIEDVPVVYQNWVAGELRTYPSDASHIADLVLGDGVRLDAIFTSKQTLATTIREGCGNGCPIRMLGDSPYFEPLAFALDRRRKNSESLLKKLNAIIQSMYDDGTLVKLSMKFFKTDLIPALQQ